MNLSTDFKEFLKLLKEHDAKYLITGGYAVGVYGYPRFTGDLDIWIDKSIENGEKLLKVLNDFGFGSLGLNLSDFTADNEVIQLGYPPIRLDILTDIDGVQFSECYPKKNVLIIDNLEVSFISLEDLKTNKLATGRKQDLADLEHLK